MCHYWLVLRGKGRGGVCFAVCVAVCVAVCIAVCHSCQVLRGEVRRAVCVAVCVAVCCSASLVPGAEGGGERRERAPPLKTVCVAA